MPIARSHILVVDDELFFRNLYRELLQQDPYDITICESGDEATRLIAEQSFDLVLTDMVMPGKDGLDILKAARTASNPADVILVTGHASLESAIDALKSGARDYLVKPFDPVELQHIVSNCLEQRRLLAENDQLRSQVQLFMGAQVLSSLLEFEDLLPQALTSLMRHISVPAGMAFTVTEKKGVTLFSTEGISEVQANKVIASLKTQIEHLCCFAGDSANTPARLAKLNLDDDILLGLAFSGEDGTTVAILLSGVPESVLGNLSSPNLCYLCDQILLGFQNACRYQSAQQLMYTDDLTGLYNHRYMQVALTQEIKRAQRYGLMFSLLFLDLDHFKNINDTHGHLAGSAALKEVGGLLRDSVRSVDILFRYGGDEFAILLVEAEAEGARCIAERIRKTIESHTFLDEHGTPSYMTVTAGFSTFPVDAKDHKTLLHLADKAMYSGKGMRNITRGISDLPKK